MTDESTKTNTTINPFAGMAAAIRHGTGSAQWNKFLSQLAPSDRRTVIKSARAINVYAHHALYWPQAKRFERFKEGR